MKELLLILLLTVAVNARIARETADGHQEPVDWWMNGVFYQIFPRSFKDSNGTGSGDIRGIIDSLGHFDDLGVDGIILGPVFMSPMMDNGYDITNYRQVDPTLGTNEDLVELFDEAKKLGIKIILDFIPNHTSDQHEWFRNSVMNITGFEDFYIWRNCPPTNPAPNRQFANNWISLYHGPMWTYNEMRDQCYLHQFSRFQPDLNLRNDNAREEMLAVVNYWLELGVDGFRIDSASHLFEIELLGNEQQIPGDLDRTRRDSFIIQQSINQPESYEFVRDVRQILDTFTEAEAGRGTILLMSDGQMSIEHQSLWYGSSEEERGSHIPFNHALISDLDGNSDAQEFKDRLESVLDPLAMWMEPNWVLGDHNTPRVSFRYGERRHDSMAILSLLLPGPNTIYYGEEIGMSNNLDIQFDESVDPISRNLNESVFLEYSRDPARTPFQWDDTAFAGFSSATPWLPVNSNYRTVNLKAQKAADKSTYKLYKDLIQLRKTNRVLQIGSFHSTAIHENLFGFIRTLAHHHTIAVIINLGPATSMRLEEFLHDEYEGSFRGRILTTNTESALAFGREFNHNEYIILGAYDAIVLEVSSAGKLAVSTLLIAFGLIKFMF